MKRRALILGLDDPSGTDPVHAFSSSGTYRLGERLVEIIREEVPSYAFRDLVCDFWRANLYPVGHPAHGPGSRDVDSRLADWAVNLARLNECDTIFCLGKRVFDAVSSVDRFELTVEQIAHPLGRNRYYADKRRRRKVAKALIAASSLGEKR